MPEARLDRRGVYPEVMGVAQGIVRLTPLYELVEGGWTQASLVELPGVLTAAPTREEAQDLLVDALREFLLSFGPDPAASSTTGDSESLVLTITTGTASAA